jgi:ketosteroid isomerase-like protein
MTNTQIIKGMYEAFGRGDIAAVLNSLADDIEWVTPGPSTIPYAGRYRGRAEVAGHFQKLAENTELDPFTIERYVEQDDVVVVLGSYTGRSKGLQKPFRSKWAMVFTLSGGKVTRFEEHMDTAAIASAYTGSATAARS